MTTIIALNVVFAAAVILGIVGMLARSIAGQDGESVISLARSARQPRPTTAGPRPTGRTVETRA